MYSYSVYLSGLLFLKGVAKEMKIIPHAVATLPNRRVHIGSVVGSPISVSMTGDM